MYPTSIVKMKPIGPYRKNDILYIVWLDFLNNRWNNLKINLKNKHKEWSEKTDYWEK